MLMAAEAPLHGLRVIELAGLAPGTLESAWCIDVVS